MLIRFDGHNWRDAATVEGILIERDEIEGGDPDDNSWCVRVIYRHAMSTYIEADSEADAVAKAEGIVEAVNAALAAERILAGGAPAPPPPPGFPG